MACIQEYAAPLSALKRLVIESQRRRLSGEFVRRGARHRRMAALCKMLSNEASRTQRGISSAGRAPALQAGGRRFDPVILHQKPKISRGCLSLAFEESKAALFNKTEEGCVTRAEEAGVMRCDCIDLHAADSGMKVAQRRVACSLDSRESARL